MSRVVFFDAGGTLFDVHGSVGECYSRVAADFGLQADPEALQRTFLQHFRQQPPLAFPAVIPEDKLNELEKNWWRRLVQQVFAGYGDFARFDEFYDALYEFFRRREAWQLFADVLPALELLRGRGVRLGVISNFDSRLIDILRAIELLPYFSSIHYSSLAGAAKPDPAIFRAALLEQNADPAEAWHVGDSLREDASGAAGAGLHGVWLDRHSQSEAPEGIIRITSLTELADLCCG